jgi:hypothetical protein
MKRCLNHSSHTGINSEYKSSSWPRFITIFLQENAGIDKDEAAIASTLISNPYYPHGTMAHLLGCQ